ncbi:ribokinase [Oscillibacter sp.]|uniref:ribokinase n=1 Tax=Oscillibacter sp. TaxID=1945593 RepID=UPI002614B0D2|nr:ribokinase [Oscillibacter sp.]MDD3347444.1 ribokinase [Oscillibacter sp.]
MRITVLGDLLYDCFIWADRLPRVGETVTGDRNGFYAGGKGGNQAVQAARLGAEVHMIGKVGRDERGAFLLENLRREGIHAEFVSQEGETGTCCVHVDHAGHNAIIVAPLANEKLTVEEVRRAQSLIEHSDVLLMQLQVNEEAVTEALRIAHGAGVRTVLNPAPARNVPGAYFKTVDFFTPNETEAEFFTGYYQSEMENASWRRAVVDAFRKKGVRNLIVTLGERGCLYAGEEDELLCPPYPVEAVDTTAAGDSFNAALCVSLAGGDSLAQALRRANAAGALTASRHGSLPSMPDRETLETFMRRNAT